MLSAMVQHMHFGGVEVNAGGLVADEGVLVPAIPQPVHHLGEFRGTVITIGVGRMLLQAVVERFRLVVRRHQVPSGSSTADLVQRSELPSQCVWLGGGCVTASDYVEHH